MTGWAALASPLLMPVRCGQQEHRLRWSGGRVEPLDHPELEAELALVALGGVEPACVAHYRLWQEALADGGFVAEWAEPTRLNPPWLSWLAMALERMRAEGFHEFLRHLPPARAQRMGEFLATFPPSWVDRAAAEVNQILRHGAGADDQSPDRQSPGLEQQMPYLVQGTKARVRRAFVDAIGGRQLPVGTAALVPLSLTVVANTEPRIEGSLVGAERRVVIQVDDRWLHQVWGTGAAVIDGQLVLALAPEAPAHCDGAKDGRYRAQVVRWSDDGDGPVMADVSVVGDSGRWRAGPEPAPMG